MLTCLFESSQYKPSLASIKKLYTSLKNKYFDSGDIDKNVKLSFKFIDGEKIDDAIGAFYATPENAKDIINNKKTNCVIYLNNDVVNDNENFNEELLEEVLLHEMIHIYQLSKEPEVYLSNKFEEHDKLFKSKADEIKKKYGHEIRENLTPIIAISHSELDKFYDDIINNSSIVLLSTLDTPINDFFEATLIPDNKINVIIEYIQNSQSSISSIGKIEFFDKIKSGVTVNDIKSVIPSVLGLTKTEIYENSVLFNTKIKTNTFIPSVIKRNDLDDEIISILNDSEKESI